MSSVWIKASEIGDYLYCERAWWYRSQGLASANVQELATGTQHHARHGGSLRRITWQRGLAFILIVLAVLLVLAQLLQ